MILILELQDEVVAGQAEYIFCLPVLFSCVQSIDVKNFNCEILSKALSVPVIELGS